MVFVLKELILETFNTFGLENMYGQHLKIIYEHLKYLLFNQIHQCLIHFFSRTHYRVKLTYNCFILFVVLFKKSIFLTFTSFLI